MSIGIMLKHMPIQPRRMVHRAAVPYFVVQEGIMILITTEEAIAVQAVVQAVAEDAPLKKKNLLVAC